jgi:thiol-disulfide isomerase/thioredoxin
MEISVALQDKLDAFKADFESGRFPVKPPREALDTMHRATAELIASGQAQRARKAGDVAPEFTLTDPDGKPVSSRDLLAKGPLVVSFYRGVWCPYCNLELQALQEALPEIAARGASLVAISPQTAPNSRKSRAPFTAGGRTAGANSSARGSNRSCQSATRRAKAGSMSARRAKAAWSSSGSTPRANSAARMSSPPSGRSVSTLIAPDTP